MKNKFIHLKFLFCLAIIILNLPYFAQDSKHEKWHYYMNAKGEEVIKVSAIRVDHFSEGMAMVTKYYWDGGPNAYNNYGFIDTSGKLVIKHEFEDASKFKFGVAAVKKRGENHYYIIDKTGKRIIDKNFPKRHLIQDNIIFWWENNSFGMMDFQGNILVNVGKYVDFSGFDETGLCCVGKEKDANTWLYGFIDKNGKEVIPCSFKQEGTSRFDDGLARMKMQNGKTGFIDTKGKVAIPGVYGTAGAYSEGFYTASFGKSFNMWGLVDSNNNVVIKGIYDDLRSPYKGLVRVELKGKHGYLKTDGSVFIPVEYDNWLNEYEKDGIAVFEKGETKFVFNLEGKLILKSNNYRYLSPDPINQIIIYKENDSGKAGIMNFDGEIIYQNDKYCHLGRLNSNRAIAIYCD
jgi:hypothetical protein